MGAAAEARMGIARAVDEDATEGHERPDSWRPSSDEEEELLAPGGAGFHRGRGHVTTKGCTGVAVCALVVLLLCALILPKGSPEPPEKLATEDPSAAKAQAQSDALGAAPPAETEEATLCKYDSETVYCPTSELWLNREVQTQVARDIVRDAGDIFGSDDSDFEDVLVQVQFAFESINTQLAQLDPTVEKELSMVEVNEAERNALLTAMQLMNDPSVQAVGRDIGHVMRRSISVAEKALQDGDTDATATDVRHENLRATQDFMRQQIETSLADRFDEIQKLRKQVVPDALLKLWGKNEPERLPSLVSSKWQMTLEEANIAAMTQSDAEPQMRKPSEITKEEKASMAEAAAIIEGRYLLDVLLGCVKWLRPAWSTDLLDSLDFARPELSRYCDPDAPIESTDVGDEEVDLVQSVLCKLKFGAMGMDALREG